MHHIIQGKELAPLAPHHRLEAKKATAPPEDIFAAALASCINTLFLLIAKNSQLGLKTLRRSNC